MLAEFLEATGQLREIPGHQGYFVTRNGSVLSTRRGIRFLAQQANPQGYMTVTLDRKTRRVHQLMMEAWGLAQDGLETRHLDGVPDHNVLGNLAAGTSSENKLDQVRLGTHANARKTHCSKGHDFSVYGYRRSNGQRRCLPCHAENERNRQARKAGA